MCVYCCSLQARSLQLIECCFCYVKVGNTKKLSAGSGLKKFKIGYFFGSYFFPSSVAAFS